MIGPIITKKVYYEPNFSILQKSDFIKSQNLPHNNLEANISFCNCHTKTQRSLKRGSAWFDVVRPTRVAVKRRCYARQQSLFYSCSLFDLGAAFELVKAQRMTEGRAKFSLGFPYRHCLYSLCRTESVLKIKSAP